MEEGGEGEDLREEGREEEEREEEEERKGEGEGEGKLEQQIRVLPKRERLICAHSVLRDWVIVSYKLKSISS